MCPIYTGWNTFITNDTPGVNNTPNPDGGQTGQTGIGNGTVGGNGTGTTGTNNTGIGIGGQGSGTDSGATTNNTSIGNSGVGTLGGDTITPPIVLVDNGTGGGGIIIQDYSAPTPTPPVVLPNVPENPNCPRLTDFGLIYGNYGGGSSGYNNPPGGASQFLNTTTQYNVAQMNLDLKNALTNRLNGTDQNYTYSWTCIGATIYQYLCGQFTATYTRYPGSGVQVVKFNIPLLGPDDWYVTDSGGLCKIKKTPRVIDNTPPVIPPVFDVPPTDPRVSPPPPAPPPTPPGDGLGSGKVFTQIDVSDVIPYVREDIYKGIWSGDTGSLLQFYTSSTQYTGSGRSHYVIYNKDPRNICSAPQFDIAYGHDEGSGSIDLGASNDYFSPSNAIYGQYRLLCLPAEQTQFEIGGVTTDSIYIINVKQERMKDRFDEGNWELNLHYLSGSQFIAGGGTLSTHTGSNVSLDGTNRVLRLIDDSRINDPIVTQGGDAYQIVSGSIEDGVYNSTAPQVFGLVYPAQGILVIDANRLDLSASFGTVTSVQTAGDNAFKLFTAMSGAALYTDASGDYKAFFARRKEIEYNSYYFIRVHHNDYNFTNNPTYQTGSEGDIVDFMLGSQNVYITTVGLYNQKKELLGIGKVSAPLLKTPSEEAMFTVKLKVG